MNDLAVKIRTAKLGFIHLFFLGQAGFIIKSPSGMLLGIDLYLSDCVERVEGNVGFKRLMPIFLEPSELCFDYLIASHEHFDHFDMDAMPMLMSSGHTKLFASVNCKKEVRRLMISEVGVTYVKAGDCLSAGDCVVNFVNCDHGTGAPDAVGIVVSVGGKKIYITGDTCLRLDRIDEIKSFGALDVLIAPINGAYGNLNEHECVELCNALSPKLVIPCHYGMFAAHGGDPGLFMRYAVKEVPEQKYLLMAPCEQLTI